MRPFLIITLLGYSLAALFLGTGAFFLGWERGAIVLDRELLAAPLRLARATAPGAVASPPTPGPLRFTAEDARESELFRAGELLAGGLVAYDAAGVGHVDCDGSLALEVEHGGSWQPLYVHVRAGRWVTRVPPGAERFRLTGAEIERIPALPLVQGFRIDATTPREAVELPAPELDAEPAQAVAPFAALEVQWPTAATLAVVSRDGRALAGVDVVGATRGIDEVLAHPGDPPADAFVARDASSPVELPAALGTRTWWVRAAGHAWERVRVDHTRGGERTVELRPAGSVEVAVRGLEPEARPMLRVRDADAPPNAPPRLQVALQDGRAVVESLPTGSYLARVEVGEWWAPARPLAETRFDLLARWRQPLVLDARAAQPEAAPVGLGGTLVAEGELPADAALVLRSITPGAPPVEVSIPLERGSDSGPFAWDAGEVRPGRYVARVDPLELRQVVDVGPRGAADVELRVPPLGRLTVGVVDDRTGEPVPGARVRWFRRPVPTGGAGWNQRTVPVDPATGSATWLAPRGELTLTAVAEGYDLASTSIVLASPERRHVLRLAPFTGIRVVLMDGGDPLPVDATIPIHASPCSGGGHVRSWSTSGSARLLGVSAPGRWRVEVGPVPGYARPRPREVDVRPGRTPELEIALQRLR